MGHEHERKGRMSNYHGHMTKTDGSHVALSADEAQALWDASERIEAKAAADMPDTFAAVGALFRARERLKRLGWREGIYCPKDGSAFAFIQFGSTGIFAGRYRGQWPDGRIDNGDGSAAPEGVMWKSIDALTDAERALMEKCVASHAEWVSGLGRSFGV
jgi:hypothetical protein